MICKDCAWEADHQKIGDLESAELAGHDICRGCDCQHKPVREGQVDGLEA